MTANDIVKKLKICFVNEMVHMKQEGICYDTLNAEFNRGEIKTLLDEVSDHCEYFGISDVVKRYTRPDKLKKSIFLSSMNKLWMSLITSKKAPGPRTDMERRKQGFTFPCQNIRQNVPFCMRLES